MAGSFIRSRETSAGPASIEVVAGRGFSLLGHSHPAPHLMFMLQGRLIEDGRSLGRGDVRFSPGGDEHFVCAPAGAHCLLVSADSLEPAVTMEARLTITSPRIALLADVVARAASDQRGGTGAREDAVGRLLGAAGEARARAETRVVPPWLVELRHRVSRGGDTPMRVNDLARRAGVSREHLARSFRHNFGSSVSAYLRARRLARAWRRLVATDWPLADVAFDAGFADQSHLTRQMRAAYGVTPGALRHRPRSVVTFVQDLPSSRADTACHDPLAHAQSPHVHAHIPAGAGIE